MNYDNTTSRKERENCGTFLLMLDNLWLQIIFPFTTKTRQGVEVRSMKVIFL